MKKIICICGIMLSVILGEIYGFIFDQFPKIELSSIAYAQGTRLSDPYRKMIASGKYALHYTQQYNKTLDYENIAVNYHIFEIDQDKSFSQYSLKCKEKIISIIDTVICKEGKVYSLFYDNNFIGGKMEGLMIPENQLHQQRISSLHKPFLPLEFSVLEPREKYTFNGVYLAPEFQESGEIIVNNKKYAYEKYYREDVDIYGEKFTRTIFLYFDNNILVKLISSLDGHDPYYYFQIEKFTSDVNQNIFNIPKGFKIYAAPIGDVNDLLKKKILIEKY